MKKQSEEESIMYGEGWKGNRKKFIPHNELPQWARDKAKKFAETAEKVHRESKFDRGYKLIPKKKEK